MRWEDDINTKDRDIKIHGDDRITETEKVSESEAREYRALEIQQRMAGQDLDMGMGQLKEEMNQQITSILSFGSEALYRILIEVLNTKKDDKIFIEDLAISIKSLAESNLSKFEKYNRQWARRRSWMESRLASDPALTARQLAEDYCRITHRSYKERRVTYLVAKKIKHKHVMREVRRKK